jgi:hypothetical protein
MEKIPKINDRDLEFANKTLKDALDAAEKGKFYYLVMNLVILVGFLRPDLRINNSLKIIRNKKNEE